MDNPVFGFIGTGHMGGALARAAAKTLPPERLLLSNRTPAKAEALAAELGCRAATVEETAGCSTYLFLGVKPQGLRGLAEQLVPVLSRRRDRFVLVSMAAGVTIDQLRMLFNADYPVARICPNTPAAVGKGLVGWCSRGVNSAEMDELCTSMRAAGLWDELPEEKMDICSVLGGSTPAFAYMFIEALADGAVRCGLPRSKATQYAALAVEGAASLLLQSGEHPGALKDAVCSPSGCTIVGVNTLEEHAFRAGVMDAVYTAVERATVMAKGK